MALRPGQRRWLAAEGAAVPAANSPRPAELSPPALNESAPGLPGQPPATAPCGALGEAALLLAAPDGQPAPESPRCPDGAAAPARAGKAAGDRGGRGRRGAQAGPGNTQSSPRPSSPPRPPASARLGLRAFMAAAKRKPGRDCPSQGRLAHPAISPRQAYLAGPPAGRGDASARPLHARRAGGGAGGRACSWTARLGALRRGGRVARSRGMPGLPPFSSRPGQPLPRLQWGSPPAWPDPPPGRGKAGGRGWPAGRREGGRVTSL